VRFFVLLRISNPIYRSGSGGGTVDFQEFVGGLSAFSSRGGREEKLKCAPPIPFIGLSSETDRSCIQGL
jgi:hypothetical protein